MIMYSKKCLYSRCLHVLLRLARGYEHKDDYVRTLIAKMACYPHMEIF